MQTYKKSSVTTTGSFDFHLSPEFFPAVKVIKPFYCHIKYNHHHQTDLVVVTSITFSPLALEHIDISPRLLRQIDEAAKNNAADRMRIPKEDLFETFGKALLPTVH